MLLETGGHVPLDRVDPRVVKIVDVKAPGSGMQSANLLENLGPARAATTSSSSSSPTAATSTGRSHLVRERDLDRGPRRDVLAGLGHARRRAELAEWIRDCGRPIRLGLQLHKLLWGDVPGR